MHDHWELLDLVKAVASLVAGMLLGLERELKDKAAGLKTITIICLGAALFSLISYKIGGTEDTRIASYIVGGVGFLGAGVIFKDGITISGLTTAGIIWFAAAIGTGIGFGQFYLAGIFLVAGLVLIYFGSYLNKLFKGREQARELVFEIDVKDLGHKEDILDTIRSEKIMIKENIMEADEHRIRVTLGVVIHENKIAWLQYFLVNHPLVRRFTF